MVEAKSANLKLVTSELDFVRDLVDPDETFDPDSATSMMRAVKRCLELSDDKQELLKPEKFLNYVFGG